MQMFSSFSVIAAHLMPEYEFELKVAQQKSAVLKKNCMI